ncbi:MAG: lysylphosphatidylglycerol synthase transmembrane domain-containing protein [Polyangiaceae bacterium]
MQRSARDASVPAARESDATLVKLNLRTILWAMLLGVAVYGGYAVWRGVDKMGAVLADYAWSSFALACALAFGNYVLRFLKWEFYLARLDIRGIGKIDSLLTFFSGFVLTVTPGKVGEVFKSVVLEDTHGVPIARTAPIVVAERVTDLIGIIVLIVLGSLGFPGGLGWAIAGSVLVVIVLGIVASRSISLGLVGVVERMGKLGARIGPKLRDAYESLAVLVSPRNLAFPTLVSIVAWSLECLSLWIILRGFGESTSVTLSAFFYATSTLAGALVPLPGGLGVTETILQGQLRELGHVGEAQSTAAMILCRFATLWFAVLVGFAALSLLRRRHPSLLRDGGTKAGTSASVTPTT